MKTTAFICYLMLASATLCANAAETQTAQTPATGTAAAGTTATGTTTTGTVATVTADETPAEKTVRRAPRGPTRPRLFWMRRSSK
jgi:hypothetical protein